MPTARRLLLHMRRRPRLLSSLFAGVLGGAVLWPYLPRPTVVLIGWDVTAGLYVLLAFILMMRAAPSGIRERAKEQDDGALIVLTLSIVAALASLGAIVLELRGLKTYPARDQIAHLTLAGLTIVCSWFLVHTSFALHYAHSFYAGRTARAHALEFPGSGDPDYLDFAYFAFVIGATAQTADVSVTTSRMRRLVILHCIVTFFFNTTLLALAINIAAGLV